MDEEPTLAGIRTRHLGLPPRKARRAEGRAARDVLPLAGHASVGDAERDPVEVLERQAESRVAELIALRYARMSASPFAFYRGAAALMAIDLRALPASGLHAQLCGDAHLSNVGMYASPERRLVFDLNDFDETSVGPFEWDLKRMATSFEIAARANGFDEAECRRIVVQFTRSYARTMKAASRMPVMDVFRTHVELERTIEDLTGQLGTEVTERAVRGLAKARRRDSLQAVRSMTTRIDDDIRFVSDPPLVTPIRDLIRGGRIEADQARERLADLLDGYEATLPEHRRHIIARYRIIDWAFKVVGVGSVGTRAWLLLLRGNGARDLLVMQAKEAQRSVLEPPEGGRTHDHEGRRVVEGQRLMQALSDPLLGWTSSAGVSGSEGDFYVRQFRDMKGSMRPELMDPPTLTIYADYCALVLARAHARGADAAVIRGYLGDGREFADAVASFAAAYADRNDVDHAALVRAIETGRIAAH